MPTKMDTVFLPVHIFLTFSAQDAFPVAKQFIIVAIIISHTISECIEASNDTKQTTHSYTQP